MRNIKTTWSIILLFLLNSMVFANNELVGSIEGDVSVSSGVASYSLPINTPTASKGYSPSLSVNYKQGGSNGSLGLGFSLGGLSSISKCTTTERIDDVKGGISFSANDKYCLDGQRLIEHGSGEYRLYSSPSVKVVRSGSAANPDSWTVYSADGYISKYGTDDKSKTTSSKGTLNWKISSKTDRFENSTTFNYTTDENSIYIDSIEYQQYKVKFNYKNREDTIATYAFGKKSVHKKLLENIETYANEELFSTYKMSYSQIDKSKHTSRFSKLEELTYCDSNNECLKPVKLSYEEREIYNDVEYSAELSVDELLNYVVADMNRDGFNDVCYYDGKLNCAMNKGNGEFETAKVWTEALNTEDVYNENSPKHGFGIVADGITKDKDKSKLRSAISSTLTLLDLNRDEYMDYCVVTETGVFCGLNNKNNAFENDKFYSKAFTVEDAFRFTDINQDKKIDLCAFTDKGLECSINSNNKFAEPVVIENISAELMIKQEYTFWKFKHYLGGGNKYGKDVCRAGACNIIKESVKIPQPQLLDINNDGFIDICGLKKDTHDFYCAEGIGLSKKKLPLFGTLKPWAKELPLEDNSKVIKIQFNQDTKDCIRKEGIKSRRFNRTIRYSDLNSDGLVDICYRNMNNYECRINNGTSFNAPTTWLTLDETDWPLTVEKNDGEADLQWIINNQEASINLSDKDGDGVPDFSAVVDNALMFASNQDGKFQKLEKIIDIVPDITEINIRKNGVYTRPVKKWFGLKTDFHTVYGSLAYGPVKPVADLDGKENIETCYRDVSGLSCVAINKQPIALLKTVTSSLGLKTTLNYGKLLSDKFYVEQNDATAPVNDYSPNSFLVKSISTDNGVGGQNELTYEYEGYKTHKDRGGLGFKKITITNPLKESKTVTTYIREDSALNGKVDKTEAYVRDVLVSESKTEYDIVETSDPKSKRVRVVKQQTIAYDLKGKKLSTKVVENKKFNYFDQIEDTIETIYDASGEVKKVQTITEYENKTSTWILAKPKHVKVTHTTPSDSVIKESTFEYNDKGELTKEVLEPSSDDKLITLYKMNNERTEGTITVKDSAGNERKSYTSYDEYGRVVSTKNVLGHKQTTTYDELCSLPKTITGVNGLKTEFEYDGLCRETKQTLPDGNTVETFYDWSTGTNLGIDFQNVGVLDDDTSVYMVTSRSSVGGWGRTFFDALDRKVRTVSQTTKLNQDKEEETVKIFTDFVYDNKGQLVASTIPYFEGMMAGASSQWKKVKYDILGRVIEQRQPSPRGDMITTTSYNGLTVTTNSPKGHSTKVEKNVLDQTVSVEENDGSMVEFEYDALGNLVKTTTNATVSSVIEYDEFSRKISMKDRTLGTWRYDYNAFGELITQTDAKGQVSSIIYDKLGRVKTKTEGGVTTTFVYDTAQNGIGKIASSSNGKVKKTYEYNTLGQVTTSTQSIDKQHFETNFEYNDAGQVSQIAYPSGMRLKYEYDINGLTKRVGIPKNDIWTQDFIDLQEDLIKIQRYIEELERDADKAKIKVADYQKKAEYYNELLREYSSKGKQYEGIIKNLEKSRQTIQHRFNKYAKRARDLRTKANYFNKYFKNVVFDYIKTVGGNNYYRYQKCVDHNWKGHCKEYRNYNFTVEKEVSNYTKRWTWKGNSYTSYVPLQRINLSKEYTKWANIYEQRSKNFEYKRNQDLKRNTDDLNHNKKTRDWYKAQAKWARDNAKYYAELAAKETKALEEINKKLESQRSAFDATSEQIEAIRLDDSTFTLWAATSRNAQGRLEGEWYGNGYMTTRHYNSDNTIDQIKTGVGKNLIRDIRYTYDARNNILSKTDKINGTVENYTYDDMDRIDSWQYKRDADTSKKRTAKIYNRTYHYDIDGNMDFKTGMGVMSYNERNQLTSTEGDSDFEYDANGNMLSGNNKYYDYNAFNKVKALSYGGSLQTFDYDESNELVKKVINNNTTIYYVGTGYEVELTESELGTKEVRRHNIMVEGNPVAVHTQTIMPDRRKADKTAYIHRDLLGSVDTVTDNKKAIVYRNEFTPYGENISNLEGNKKFQKEDLRGFTGHRQISEANIINMNARLYDPELGRFTSADTIIPDPLKPMAYNRYMYVYGNPTGYRDPDGHFAITALFVIGAAIFTVGATTDDPTIAKVGMTIGSIMMMGADMGMSAVAQGATTGFTTSFISTGGDMGAAIQGGVTSAVSAGLAEGIGHGGYFETNSVGQYLAHGASQGFITVLRGGKFKNGFISGIVGKAGGQATDVMGFSGDTMSDRIGSTTIVAVFGGLASEATGGDFYEGAMRAAFVHLYNDLASSDNIFSDDLTEIIKTEKGKELWGKITDMKEKVHIIAISDECGSRCEPIMTKGKLTGWNVYVYKGSKSPTWLAGKVDGKYTPFQPSRMRTLAHELGHTTGTLDDGGTFSWQSSYMMNNVNTWENPIMTQLDGITRTRYIGINNSKYPQVCDQYSTFR